MIVRRLRVVNGDEVWARIGALTARAARGGYRLIRDSAQPYRWVLLDAEDGECLYSALTLEDIERWLDE